jgi:hypothetical protein
MDAESCVQNGHPRDIYADSIHARGTRCHAIPSNHDLRHKGTKGIAIL